MEAIYLKRKIDSYLINWKKDVDRKPLIVKGARQVGKTESIRRFAEENYKNVIYINFVEEPKYKMIAEDGYKIDDIIRNISRMDPFKKFEPGETILIFDELQEFPEIATSLKFFKLEGRFVVILRKCGYELFYHKKDASYLEEDFFVRTKDYLVPVEVKATNGTAKSLRTLLRSDSYPDIKYGIKFTSGNIGYSDNIYTFPYFCAFLLKNYLKEVSLERESRG